MCFSASVLCCKAAHACLYLTRWSGLALFVNLQTGNYTANTAGTDRRRRLCVVKTKLSVMVQTRQSIKISSVITFAHRYLTVRYLTLFAVQLCLHKYSYAEQMMQPNAQKHMCTVCTAHLSTNRPKQREQLSLFISVGFKEEILAVSGLKK